MEIKSDSCTGNTQPEMYQLCETIGREIELLRQNLEPVIRPCDNVKNEVPCEPEPPMIQRLRAIHNSLAQLSQDISL